MEQIVKDSHLQIKAIMELVPTTGDSVSVANGSGVRFTLERSSAERFKLGCAVLDERLAAKSVEILITISGVCDDRSRTPGATYELIDNGLVEADRRSAMPVIRDTLTQFQEALTLEQWGSSRLFED